MSLLEQDITRKGQVETAIELDNGDKEEYEIKVICNGEVYAKKSNNSHHLPGLYYLVLWKGYSEEENIWKLVLAI